MKEFNQNQLLLLAYIDGELSKAEIAQVEALLAEDAALMNEYRLLAKTILPATDVVYSKKSTLKKATTKKVRFAYALWASAAAAVAILLVLYIPNTSPATTAQVQQYHPNKITKLAQQMPSQKENPVPQAIVSIPLKVSTLDSKKENISHTGVDAKITNVETPQFDKKELPTTLLAIKNKEFTPVPLIALAINNEVELSAYTPSTFIDNASEVNKGWLAKTSDKINATLNNWIGYLQKPDIDISKKAPANGGIYWAITVETDKYDWQGRLYTRR